MLKKLILLHIIHYSLLIAVCVAQYSKSHDYLSQFNIWLPGSHAFHQNIDIHPYRKRALSDTLFYWHYINVQGFGPMDIFFIDSLYGWDAYCGGGVMRTTTGGYSWDTTGLISGGCIIGVYFINNNTGWAVGEASTIRKTTNGGINWIVQDPPDSSGYYPMFFSVHFFNSDTGIVIGARSYSQGHSYVIRTSDSGNNWNEIYVSSGNDNLYRQFWLNNYTGWMCGSNILLKTTDGGLTYTNYYSNIPPTQNGSNGLLDLYFINENTGWICGGNLDHKNIYKTTNTGINWIFQDNPVAYYGLPQINGIKFINTDTGFASSFVGIILITTNAGANWIINQIVNEPTWYFAKYVNSKIWLNGDLWKIWFTLNQSPIGITNSNQYLKIFKLFYNFPNPFNSETIIKYEIPCISNVVLTIYNILGSEIEKLVEKRQNPGQYVVNWNASKYASGVYFYQLRTENYIETKKLVLLK